METAIALIAFFIITILVAPNLLTREVMIGLIALGVLALAQPGLLDRNREVIIAIIAFGILFTLIIPKLSK
jgi:hypothetical protein